MTIGDHAPTRALSTRLLVAQRAPSRTVTTQFVGHCRETDRTRQAVPRPRV